MIFIERVDSEVGIKQSESRVKKAEAAKVILCSSREDFDDTVTTS